MKSYGKIKNYVKRTLKNKLLSYDEKSELVEVSPCDLKYNKWNKPTFPELNRHIRNNFLNEGYNTEKGYIIIDKNNTPIDGNNRSYLLKRYFPETNVTVKKWHVNRLTFYFLSFLYGLLVINE